MADKAISRIPTIFPLTLVLDTAQYASGDVMVVPQEIAGVCPGGRGAVLTSMVITDLDDQGGSLEVLLTGESISIGTLNAAYAIAQADAGAIQARIAVASGDFADYGSFKYAQYGPAATGMGGVLQSTVGSSLWLGVISRDTKTQSAAGILVKLGFEVP